MKLFMHVYMYLSLRLACEHQEATITNLTDPNGDDVHLDHPALWREHSTEVIGDLFKTRANDHGAYDEADNVDKEGERGKDLEADEGKIVAHGRRGRVERNVGFHHLA
jgi:hypothetical protein